MKILTRMKFLVLLLVFIPLVILSRTFFTNPPKVFAAITTVNLLTAGNFAVLAGQHISSVPTSTIIGDVGLSPAAGSFITGLTAVEVTGTIYAVDATGPGGSVSNPGLVNQAKSDLTAAYLDAAGRTPATVISGSDNQLGGQTLTTGIYSFGHASTANLTAASPLTLDAQGDPNAVFIFQASSDLVTASGSVVRLVNGALACNVFWQVTSSATLGTGSTFVGSILALTTITDNGGSTVNGRLLARNTDVIVNKTTITRQACSATATPTLTSAAIPTISPTTTVTLTPTAATPTTSPTTTVTLTPTVTPTATSSNTTTNNITNNTTNITTGPTPTPTAVISRTTVTTNAPGFPDTGNLSPGLPNTGFAPQINNPWYISIFSSLFHYSSSILKTL